MNEINYVNEIAKLLYYALMFAFSVVLFGIILIILLSLISLVNSI